LNERNDGKREDEDEDEKRVTRFEFRGKKRMIEIEGGKTKQERHSSIRRNSSGRMKMGIIIDSAGNESREMKRRQ
jgi:hypothetical protein